MRLGAIAFFIALGVCTASVARASGERILVTGLPDDPLANTIQRELEAMGFSTVRGGAASGCSPATVEEMAHAERAIAATCAAGGTVVVWSIAGKFVRLEDILYAPADDARGPQSVAVRVAEVARASVSLTGDPDALVTAAELGAADVRATHVSSAGFGPGSLREENPYAPPPETARERPPRESARVLSVGLGAAYLHGDGARVGAVDLASSLRLGRWVAPYARVLVPVASETQMVGSGVNGKTTTLSVGMALAGVGVPLLHSSSRFDVRANTGFGVAWMMTDSLPTGTAVAEAALARLPELNRVKQSTTVPAGALALTGTVRVVGPLSATADATAGMTGGAMNVVTNGVVIASWQTFIAASMRAEAVFR